MYFTFIDLICLLRCALEKRWTWATKFLHCTAPDRFVRLSCLPQAMEVCESLRVAEVVRMFHSWMTSTLSLMPYVEEAPLHSSLTDFSVRRLRVRDDLPVHLHHGDLESRAARILSLRPA